MRRDCINLTGLREIEWGAVLSDSHHAADASQVFVAKRIRSVFLSYGDGLATPPVIRLGKRVFPPLEWVMTQWFYADSGQQRGPVSENELRNLLETSRIPANTKVWTEGMQDWREATDLPGFAFSPYVAPKTDVNPEVVWDDYAPSGSQVRPWVRYWARTFDNIIFIFGMGILIAVLNPALIEESNDTLFGIIVLIAYNFVEPAMLSIFGYTPMKWLFKIRVRNADRSKLSYAKALSRTFKVWIKGQGLGIPLIALITHITSYNALKNHGVTGWDQDAGIEVSHQEIEWWRWASILVVMAGIVALVALGSEQA